MVWLEVEVLIDEVVEDEAMVGDSLLIRLSELRYCRACRRRVSVSVEGIEGSVWV